MRFKEYYSWFSRSHFPGILLLGVYSLFLFRPIPFGNWTIASQDILNQFYPWTQFWTSELKAGSFPLWNPYSFCGSPFIGNWQVACYYPPQFLLSLLSSLKCFGWTLLFHTFFAGAAMYFLLHYLAKNKVIATAMGIAYLSSGFLITRIDAGHVTIINELPWVPLALLAYLRWMERPDWGRWSLLALALAFQILGGQPQITYLTVMLLGFFSLGEALTLYKKEKPSLITLLNPSGALFLALGMALLITTVYWLPCYELNQASAMRSAGLDYQEATWGSLSPKQLALFITPFLFGDVTGREFWGSAQGTGYQELCGFLGIGTFLGLLYGLFGPAFPGKRTWIVILFISLLLAVGFYIPFYRLFYWFVPGIRFFRVPSRFLLLYSVCACVLAGQGLKYWIEERPRSRWFAWIIPLLLVLILLGSLCIIHWKRDDFLACFAQGPVPLNLQQFSVIELGQERYSDVSKALSIGLLFGMLWLGWFFIRRFFTKRNSFYGWIALGLLVLECGWFAHRFVQPRKIDEVLKSEYAQTPAIRFLMDRQSLDRILRPDAMISWWVRKEYPELFPNRLLVHRLQSARGYDVTIPGNYAGYLYGMQRMEPPERVGSYLHVGDPGTLTREFLSAMNVRYILLPVEIKIPDFKLVFEGPPWIYEYTRFFPRAFILPEEIRFTNRLPQDAAAEIYYYMPNEIHLKANLRNRGWLVVADNYDPGWKAEINGKPGEVFQVLGTFRGILLEPGRYKIRMYFDPNSLKIGSWVSGASLFCLIALNMLILSRKRKTDLES